MYCRYMQHGSCDTDPWHIKTVLGSVIPLYKVWNRLAEASSSYSLQTAFQDGGHLVFQNGTNFENNLAWVLSYHPVLPLRVDRTPVRFHRKRVLYQPKWPWHTEVHFHNLIFIWPMEKMNYFPRGNNTPVRMDIKVKMLLWAHAELWSFSVV